MIAVIDSNSNPDGIDYPIPGNDDAIRSIDCYLEMATSAILEGIQAELAVSSEDAGTSEEVNVQIPEEGSESAGHDDVNVEAEQTQTATQTGTTNAPETSSGSAVAEESDTEGSAVAEAGETAAKASNG